MQLGFENKKKAGWAIALGIIALAVFAYEVVPLIWGPSTQTSDAQAAAPIVAHETGSRGGSKTSQNNSKVENLDPTLRLDLLAMSEKTKYEGTGRNIFVSQPDDVKIPKPIAPASPDAQRGILGDSYHTPAVQPAPPIPLKFYGFASSPGEPKKIFLKLGEDVFVAGEGEIVDRRYKIIRISTTSVEIQDVLNSGPPQNIPLTQG